MFRRKNTGHGYVLLIHICTRILTLSQIELRIQCKLHNLTEYQVIDEDGSTGQLDKGENAVSYNF